MNVVQQADRSLETELLRGPLRGVNAPVVFETPDADWAARRSGPCVNAFLYGVEEDVPRRQTGESSIIDEEGVVVGYNSPKRFFRLGYALTVWGTSPREEHRVLGALLEWCVCTDKLAPSGDGIAGGGLPVKLRENTLGTQSPVSRLWTGLGTAARPVLDLIVTVPVGLPGSAVGTEPVRGLTLRTRRTDRAGAAARSAEPGPGPRASARLRRGVEEIV